MHRILGLALGLGLLGMVTTAEALTRQISCTTSSTPVRNESLFASPTLIFQNLDTTNFVWLCPSSTCTATAGIKLAPATTNVINGLIIDRGQLKSALSCLGDTGTVIMTYTVVE